MVLGSPSHFPPHCTYIEIGRSEHVSRLLRGAAWRKDEAEGCEQVYLKLNAGAEF